MSSTVWLLFMWSVRLFSVLFFGVFFVFKQKTAYEMRISDWSSDVCSSDLDVDPELIRSAAILYLEGYLWDPEAPRAAMKMAIETARAAGRKEIGRASCRERVCQYV